MDETSYLLTLCVGLVVYFTGYFNGKTAGLDQASRELGGIIDTLKKINDAMETSRKQVNRS